MQIKTFCFGEGIELKVRFFTVDEYTPPKLIRFKNDDGTFDEVIQKRDAYYKTPSGIMAEYIDIVMEKDDIDHYIELQKHYFASCGFKVQNVI